jgi:Asp/Glu/hydantoin racemase
MKLILVPPYRGAGYDFRPEQEPYYRRAIEQMRAAGQLEGVDVEVDQGANVDAVSASRDETTFDQIGLNTQLRVREIAASGRCDAIVVLGAIDVAFHSIRAVSPVPVAFVLHSALHVASLVADRFSLIDVTDTLGSRQRRLARSYGFGDKLVSIRTIGRSSTELSVALREPFESDGTVTAAVDSILDGLVSRCGEAVEQDGADLLIFGFAPLHQMVDVLRARLDAAGYAEIPVISALSAAVAMAKVMAEMTLTAAPRSFPTDDLVRVPAYR